MTKLFHYLKGSLGTIALILLLLILQAWCDLELPAYTSRIVTEGIQQKGVEDAVPDRMSAGTAENLKLFLSEESAALVDSCYDRQEEEWTLNGTGKENREALSTALADAEMILGMLFSEDAGESLSAYMTASDTSEGGEAGSPFSASGEMPDPETALAMLKAMPAAMRQQMLSQAAEGLAGVPDSIKSQMAIRFVQQEYETLGEDLAVRQNRYLLVTGGLMLLLSLAAMAANLLVAFLCSRMAAGVAYRIRKDVYRKVMSFNSEEFHHFSTASLITRSTNDVQQVQMFLAMGLRMVLFAPIHGIGGVLKVMNTNASLSWVIVLALVLLMCLLLILFKVAMPKFRILQTLIDRLNLVSREQLTGVMVTRAFTAEEHEEQRFEQANLDLTRTNLFVNRCMTFMFPAMMMIMNGISVLIIYTGARSIDAGGMQVGDMMAFIQYAMQIIMSFLMISMMSIILPRANVSAGRIAEVLGTEVAMKEPEQPVEPDEKDRGTVEFDHVSFAYPDAEENVLTDISFRAEKGQTVAFIGSTGSGKSTLVNLVVRFYDATKGTVKVDGVDVRSLSRESIARRIGYVPQKSTLFSGTIATNILYGNPDGTEEDMKHAARIAQAEEFIEEREKKYQETISQGGTNVSGGQRQRLSIARAIAKHPEILIFDDSFSALDFRTDVALRRALKQEAEDVTTLIVAQRISTIIHADLILVLDEGKLAGMGTHEELMKTCEVYRQIAVSQLSEEELAG